ncbi:hypothetical protein ACFUV1_12200 [Streptomyces griseoincarnatus]
MIGALLDTGRVSLNVDLTSAASSARTPLQLQSPSGLHTAPLTIDDGSHTLARIPADAHLDVLTVIDSGIDFDTTLTGSLLTLRLPDVR